MAAELSFVGLGSGGFGGYELTDQMLYNIKWWIDWGFANGGAFETFLLDDISAYDTDESDLMPVLDERYEEGRVWEGAGQSWVWESGIQVPSGETTPFRVSGVEINGTFHSQVSASGGTYGHHIDYDNGRVIFDNPHNPDTDIIRAQYVQRKIQTGFADSPEHRQIMLDAMEEFAQELTPSGTNVRDHQVWLPAVFIEVGETTERGLELGGGQILTTIITFHIFADNPSDRNLIKDWIKKQSRKTFNMADLNLVTWPFDEYGDVVPGTTNWVDLTKDFRWKKIRGQRMVAENINSLNTKLFRARVRWEVEVDVGGI